MNADTSVDFTPESRYCPTTKMTGWLDLRYAPQPPRIIETTTDDACRALARQIVAQPASKESVEDWAARLAQDLVKFTD